MIALISSFLILGTNYLMRKRLDFQKIQWDIETITPADYTVEMEISSIMWAKYLEEVYPQEGRQEPVNYAFKRYIKEYFDLFTSSKVADVQFAFANGDLIRKLKNRGETIMHEKWKRSNKITK